jgi:catechol 2,3-dioxygenase-like lactoylglutathione lyase family enzyme
MIRGIDHLVIACPDPDEAAATLDSELGLAVTGGGRHPGAGSWNRIAWLADGSYLELIGIDDPELASTSRVNAAALGALDAGGGLVTYALLVDDIDLTVQGLRAAGAKFGAPVHGSRARDDGEVVEWWVAFPDLPLAADGVPFLIQHAYVGGEWGPEALAERARFEHPIGSSVRLRGLDVAVNDPASTGATLHAELQLDVWALGELAVADVGAHVLRIVPRHELGLPAAVNLGAEVASPRTADLLGIHFVIEPAEVHAVTPNRP